MPNDPSSLLAGRSLTDSKAAQAFSEIIDKLEPLTQIVVVSPPPERTVGFGKFAAESLILDLDHPTIRKGLGLPQLTVTERNNLRNPPLGTIVYNVEYNCLSFWNGTKWVDECSIYRQYGTANSSTASETTLFTITLPPSWIYGAGNWFEWEFLGKFANNANNKRVRVYLDSTMIGDSTVLTQNNVPIHLTGKVINIDNTNQFSVALSHCQATLQVAQFVDLAKTLTNPLVLHVTGTAAVANNDIVGKLFVARKDN